MSNISQSFLDKVLDYLCSISALEDEINRGNLVNGLSFAAQVKVVPAQRPHLTQIVQLASSHGVISEGSYTGQHALQVIIDRTLPLIKGSEEKEQHRENLIKELVSLLEPVIYETETIRLEFVNRLDEIGQITSSYAPPYYLVDAPAGYGKTELLRALKRRFDELEWWCASVEIDEDTSISTLATKLAHQLDVDLKQTDPLLPLGRRLGGAIKHKWSQTKKGLVLLLDFVRKPYLLTFKELVREFISDMQSTLKEHQSPDLPLRVIMAGRYVAPQYEELENPKIPLAVLSLGTFDFDVVKLSIAKYLDRSDVDDLTAHLVYLTGGHPGCVAHILEIYRKKAWNTDDLLRFEQRIWNGDSYIGKEGIKDKIEKIINEIPSSKNFRNLITQLSVSRYLDNGYLKQFLAQQPMANDASSFADNLTATYLFRRHKRGISDDIARRLLVLWLRHDPDYKFEDLCKNAMNWCFNRLGDSTLTSEREVWFVEYLFQCLQQEVKNINNLRGRDTLRSVFWKENVPNALRTYFSVATYDDINVEKGVLIDRIKDDWEFQFTINYYLRENCYTAQPYHELRQVIKTFKPFPEQ